MTQHNGNLLGQLTAPTAVGSGDLLGVIVECLHCLMIGVLLCGLVWLLRELRDGWRDLARLYEMKCLEKDERNRKNNQPKSQTIKSAGQPNNCLGLSIKLRRKAL